VWLSRNLVWFSSIEEHEMCRSARIHGSKRKRRWFSLEQLEPRLALAAPQFEPGEIVGHVESTQVNAASGLTASRQNPGVLWAANDLGDERLFALDTTGRHLGIYNLSTITCRDFEDITTGPGPQAGVRYLYVADTGDNSQVRSTVTVFRVAEPAVSPTQSPVNVNLTGIDAINLRYPDGPHDAETLIVDPSNGDIYIVTKRDARSRIYFAPASASTTQVTTLQFMGELTWGGAISADISPDGDEILLLHIDRAYYYSRPAGTSITAALQAAPSQIPYTKQQLGEGITFDHTGTDYYTNSEGVNQPLWFYERIDNPQPSLVSAGSVWKYIATGVDQGTSWRSASYNDLSWSSGAAQLGYGDGDEATTIPVGSTKPITTYFRHTFSVANPSAITGLTLRLLRDDGAIVYLNGQEIARSNLPGGTITAATPALTSVGGADESRWFTFAVSPALLATGTNILAVELHQNSNSSSDISFDLELLPQTPNTPTEQTLVPACSVWNYLDNGSNQGTAWRAANFNDAAWASGAAELGYGDGDEATRINAGTSGSRPITTYFRRSFTVTDPSRITSLTLSLRRDDGAIVYLNGQEVARSNLPSGAITYTTRALTNVGGGDESRWFAFSVPPDRLVAGTNVIAVEVHQSSATSSDVSFDLELKAMISANPAPPPQIVESTFVVSPTSATSSQESPTEGSVTLMPVSTTGSSPSTNPKSLQSPSASAAETETSPSLEPVSTSERARQAYYESLGLGRWRTASPISLFAPFGG
jgi:hypothetical protein